MTHSSDLDIKDDVCVVTVVHDSRFCIFGVYESEPIARIRVQDHLKLGLLKEDDIVNYYNETVWGWKEH